jgi:hypothetical protein
MNVGLYEHIMNKHTHEVSSVAYLKAITVTLQRSLLFLLLALHGNISKLFLLLNINNTNVVRIEDM